MLRSNSFAARGIFVMLVIGKEARGFMPQTLLSVSYAKHSTSLVVDHVVHRLGYKPRVLSKTNASPGGSVWGL